MALKFAVERGRRSASLQRWRSSSESNAPSGGCGSPPQPCGRVGARQHESWHWQESLRALISARESWRSICRLNAEPRIGSVGLPADVPQPAQKIVSPAADVPPARELNPEDGARLIVPPDPVPTPPVEPPGCFAVEDSTVVRPANARPTIARPVQSLRRRIAPRDGVGAPL